MSDDISTLTDGDLVRIIEYHRDSLEGLLLTRREVAALLGVSKQAISAAVKRGQLVPILKGRLFLRSDVGRLVK